MARRLDIEVTSTRDDGSFTWRQAGAKAPKGVGASELLPAGSKVGDVLRAEVEMDMDGATVVSVSVIKQRERNVTLLEITGSGIAFQPVTEVSTNKGRRGDKRGDKRGAKGARGGRGERGARPGQPAGGNGDGRNGGGRRQFTPPPPALTKRPRPTRLRAKNEHRQAVLDALKPEERVLAEVALKGGVGALRVAVKEQNARLTKEGKPTINAGPLIDQMLELLPRLRVAEWRDTVDAVEKIIDTVDLRDLRSIVARSNDATLMKDASLNAKREELRVALKRREDEALAHWHEDLQAAVEVGRIVAALNLSGKPPKAGTPPSAETKLRLVALTVEQLTPDASSERWAVVLEALAFAPIHNDAVPKALPQRVTPELTKTVTRLAPLIPKIAALFGVAVDPKARTPRPLPPVRRDKDTKRNGKGAPRSSGGPRSNGGPRTNGDAASSPATSATATEAPATNLAAPAADISAPPADLVAPAADTSATQN
jgi:hypothetical protein